MSTLADLLSAARTDLAEADVDHLQHLVAGWQLVADLSFADLVLWVRPLDAPWLAVAHMRPTTGPTAYPDDVVGLQVEDRKLDRAWAEGRQVSGGESEWRDEVPVRHEAVPVRRGGRVVAVVSRDTNLKATRVPSQLELAYLSSAGELLQMMAEGTFPFLGQDPEPENQPRVGDGLLRLDGTGHVVYASPNALSASRRLGIARDLLGTHLGHTIAGLSTGTDTLDEPRGSAAVAAALRFREPRDSEVESHGAVVQLRVLPLLPGGQPRGALVLLRDVTEVRRRDRQIMGKDATIREIHHRVKNNLQTVAALLRLQARRMDDAPARAALEESVRRVASIAVVHELLTTALDEQVAFDAVADRVLAMCAEMVSPQAPVHVVRTGSFGVLDAEVATALSMVLTELVQNALEHAFADRAGRLEVQVTRTPAEIAVDVLDDGRGLPPGFDLAGSKRLGLQIVRTLVDGELRGTLVLQPEPAGGTRAVLRVPLRPAA